MSEEKKVTEVEWFNCCDCGIYFGIDKGVLGLWRKSHKQFVCPNGHSLVFKDPTAEEKELIELRAKVAELTKQLADKTEAFDARGQEIEELKTKLELWEPST